MSLLTIENISKSYFHRNVLDHISIRIQEGDRLGFIGPNGAGKTTLFKIITGREMPDEGQIIKLNNVIIGYLSQHMEDYSGSEFTALRNKELEDLEYKIHELESKMGHFSDHESLEYRIITTDYAKLTAQFEALDGYAYERNMKETLQGLGLADDALLRPFTTLSGGEKMRVALARILLTHPDILLLDEPTNHLDVNAMEWLEEYLSHFKGAMILISHDRYFLDKVTNQTAELDGGKLSVRPGNYSKFKEQKQVEFDFAQKEIARLEKELEHQTEVKQTMLSHRNMSGYHCREKQVNKLSDQLLQAKGTAGGVMGKKMNFKIMPKEQVGDPKRVLIEADHLSKAFDGRTIFSDVSFRFRACDKIVLVGPNGCGKSTLLSLILGNIPDFDGVVRLSSQIQYAHMGQHVVFEEEGLTALEEVLARCDCSEGYARSLLARFGFIDTDCFKKIAVLSGGERSRLYLACLLQELPDVLFLDEPTNHLDIPSREILENALVDYTGAVFAVSHDRYFIEKCVKGIYGFINGRLKEFDSYDQFRNEEKKVRQAPHDDRISPEGAASGSDDPASVQNPAKLRQNKAEERRQTAQKRERIRAAEQEIHSLEEEKSLMESGFNAETTPEEYKHYADVLTRIDRVYEIYMELQDEENATS